MSALNVLCLFVLVHFLFAKFKQKEEYINALLPKGWVVRFHFNPNVFHTFLVLEEILCLVLFYIPTLLFLFKIILAHPWAMDKATASQPTKMFKKKKKSEEKSYGQSIFSLWVDFLSLSCIRLALFIYCCCVLCQEILLVLHEWWF